MYEKLPEGVQEKLDNPLLRTAIASPIFLFVSFPLAFIAAIFATFVAGTTTAGYAVGILVILSFWALGTVTTYKWTTESKRKRDAEKGAL